MSISDGLGPSIFRQMMEKTRPVRSNMDGEVFNSLVIPIFDVVFCESTFRYLYLDLACKHFFPAKEKINLGKMKV